MKMIVEVGTAEQKTIIENELSLIEKIVCAFEPPLNISRVIVPVDFDQKVNELQKTDSYKSLRGMETIAKILEVDGGVAIILSPSIYTLDWDTQKRLFIYLHEIYHTVNKKRISRPEIQSASSSLYFENLYRIFDEYAADRQALEMIDDLAQHPSQSP